LDAGNEVFDTRVERALAERAIGFYETWEEDKINPVTGQRETFIHREYYPPDTKAANQWLTNRKRHEWDQTVVSQRAISDTANCSRLMLMKDNLSSV